MAVTLDGWSSRKGSNLVEVEVVDQRGDFANRLFASSRRFGKALEYFGWQAWTVGWASPPSLWLSSMAVVPGCGSSPIGRDGEQLEADLGWKVFLLTLPYLRCCSVYTFRFFSAVGLCSQIGISATIFGSSGFVSLVCWCSLMCLSAEAGFGS